MMVTQSTTHLTEWVQKANLTGFKLRCISLRLCANGVVKLPCNSKELHARFAAKAFSGGYVLKSIRQIRSHQLA